MPKTKLVIAANKQAASAVHDVAFFPNGMIEMSVDRYAELLEKENLAQKQQLLNMLNGKKLKAKKKIDKPKSAKQLLNETKFKDMVALAGEKYAKGANGKTWKQCMREVYAERKKTQSEKLESPESSKVEEVERLKNL
jgi:phage pi2 protein 07